ncbi:MAG: hypothetical protein JWO82_4205, partial [Akkermansiaceae bacterium]|nr:hypothetical protein [Akkermansiaceae bacterium]
LESYRLGDGHLNWRLLGLTFVDMADFDPGSDSDLYTKEEHFHFDASQPPGKEASYLGYTLAPEKYPQDPRLHIWSGGAWLRRIAGQRFLFVNDMNGDNLQVYRFRPSSDGETAIPCGLFAKKPIRAKDAWPPAQPQQGAWLWRDANGDGRFDPDEYQATDAEVPAAQGWSVDELGNVWLATETQGIRYYTCRGIDVHGSPQWDLKSVRTFPHPAGFREVKRLRYDVPSDTLYLGGTTETDRNQHWKPMGPVLACYDHGSRGGTLRWQITLPYAAGSSGHESCEPMGFDLAGDFLFVPYTGASKADQVSTGRVEIFRSRDGSAAGHLEPGPEVGEVGLQDLRETLTAHRRRDGEYDVMIEDDLKSKVVLYRLKNLK